MTIFNEKIDHILSFGARHTSVAYGSAFPMIKRPTLLLLPKENRLPSLIHKVQSAFWKIIILEKQFIYLKYKDQHKYYN